MKRSLTILMVICSLGVAASASSVQAQAFGHKGGPDIGNIEEINNLLRNDAYELELLLSFGTSKRGSAGHLALAIRDQAPDDDMVYSANFHARKAKTDYHDGPIVYGYMDLNCAKTVALAFKHGTGFKDVSIKGDGFLSKLNIVSATKANLPTETALEIVKICAGRGYRLDVVLYKKWDGSTYVNPQDEDDRMYKDLPNRFPSVLSLDYLEEQGRYEDHDNLYAMYLLYNLGRYSIVLDGATRQLKVEARKESDAYEPAKKKAHESATRDKKHRLRRVIFRAWGIKLDGEVDNTTLYDYDGLNSKDDLKAEEASALESAK